MHDKKSNAQTDYGNYVLIYRKRGSKYSTTKIARKHAKLLKSNEQAAELLEKGEAIAEQISTWEENLIQPKQKTFQDVINFNNQLNAQLMHLKGYVDTAEPSVTEGAKERLQDLLGQWAGFRNEKDKIIEGEMKAYNQLYASLGLPAIIMEE